MDVSGGASGGRKGLSAEDLERVERYLAGELTPAEVEAFARWTEIDPGRRQLVEVLSALWHGDSATGPAFDLRALWARTLPRVRERRRVVSLVPPGRGRSSEPIVRRLIPRAAAATLLLGAIGLGSWIAMHRDGYSSAPSPAMRDFSTRRGQRANLQLDDGTQVILGAATTVQIPNDYGGHTRTIYLDGQAYFMVRHDASRPFTVHAGHTIVRDIGTQFAVTAYRGAPTTQVVVAEGEVSVGQIDLRPNDLAIVDSSGDSVAVKHRTNISLALAWAQGRLAFEATPFRDVAASLSRWYDLDIEIADSALGRQPLTVTFGPESTHEVLDALALLTHTRYDQHGRAATFHAIPRS